MGNQDQVFFHLQVKTNAVATVMHLLANIRPMWLQSFPPKSTPSRSDLIKCDKALQGKIGWDLDFAHASIEAVLTRIITFITK